MKIAIITGVMAATFLMTGCGKKSPSSSITLPSTKADAGSSTVALITLKAWEQGDKARAISGFLAADWSALPLFAPGSTLGLTEGQFKTLSDSDREAESREMTGQLASLKQLAAAAEQAGLDAVSKGDAPLARKYFISVKQFGDALESSDSMLIVQLVGKGIEKRGETELAKIRQ
jgi:major membrane immunogen (membrane-anchored lipoprotein)